MEDKTKTPPNDAAELQDQSKSSVQPDYTSQQALEQGARCYEQALQYLKHGWPVIPIGWDEVKGGWKRPLVSWKKYQNVLPTESDLHDWKKKWPYARVGVVTGNFAGLIAVDIDPRKGGSADGLDLPATLISNTGGDGWHYIYRHPGVGYHIPTVSDWPRKGVDIRGDGGLIVLPPSLHDSGEQYAWALDFDPTQIADCPSWLLQKHSVKEDKGKMSSILQGVSEGSRNEAASRVAGLIFHHLGTGKMDELSWATLKQWNNQSDPPLSEKELLGVFQSIRKYAANKIEDEEYKEFPLPISSEDFMAMDIPKPKWFLNRLVPSTGLVAISGKPESYKTWFVIWMARRAACGLPLFDKKEGDESYLVEMATELTGPAKVLLVEEENAESQMQQRMKLYEGPNTPNLSFYLSINKGFKFSSKSMRDQLIAWIRENGINLIVLDPFSSVMGFENENDNAEVAKMMDIVRHEFIEDLGLCVIFLHHPSKNAEGSKNLRGAGDILGKCDVHISLEVEHKRDKVIRVTYEKLRIEDRNLISDFRMGMVKNPFGQDLHFSFIEEAQPKDDEVQSNLKEKILKNMTPEEIYLKQDLSDMSGAGRNSKDFNRVLESLVSDGLINVVTGKQHRRFTKPSEGSCIT